MHCIRACRRAISLIDTRTECIRERAAPNLNRSAHPPSSVRRGPDSKRIRAFFISDFNRPAHRRKPAIDGSHRRRRRTLFNNLPQDDLGTGRWFVLHLFCGCSSAGRARPRHGRGHEFETRHPLHFGCVHALRCRATWCWRCGMCATDRSSAPGHVQRDTTSDGMLAFGHSRSGFPQPS